MKARRHGQTRPFVSFLHTPPSPTRAPVQTPLPPHPLIPSHPFFLFRPAQRPVPWESTSDHLARGVSNEGQRDKPQALHVLAEYSFVSSYATVVCPRTPYRDDVLAPLYSLQLTPDPHLEFGGHITVCTRPHIRRHTRALSSLFGDHPHTTSYLRNKHTHTYIHTHNCPHPLSPYLTLSDCSVLQLVPGDRDSFPLSSFSIYSRYWLPYIQTFQGFVGIRPISDRPQIQPQKKKGNK